MLYFCLLLYIALTYVRPGEVVPALAAVPLLDIMSVATIFVGAIALLLRPPRFVPTPTDLCIVGFWAAIVVSNVAWGWVGGGWIGFRDFLPVVFCYFLVRIAVNTPGRLHGLIYLLVALNLMLAINGIIQYHTGADLSGVEAIERDNRIRGTGIFNDPNDLGMTLVMTVPFLLAGMAAPTAKFWQRLGCLLLLVPLVLAIYYTNSRGSFMGLGVVLVAYMYSRFHTISGTLLASMAVVLLIVFAPSRTSALEASEESAQGRIEAWAEGLQMFKARPVFGVGYGRFTEYHRRVAHNSVVHAFSELGFFGAFFFVGSFYGFFHAMKQSAREHANDAGTRQWVRALTISALGAIVCQLFLSRQYSVVTYIVLAAGVSLPALTLERRRFWPHSLQHAAAVVAITGASVVLTWIAVRTLGAWAI